VLALMLVTCRTVDVGSDVGEEFGQSVDVVREATAAES
jgi:hypothetical protein